MINFNLLKDKLCMYSIYIYIYTQVIESLTPELWSVVRKFCSHPAADALRQTVTNWGEYSLTLKDQTYPDANTFHYEEVDADIGFCWANA